MTNFKIQSLNQAIAALRGVADFLERLEGQPNGRGREERSATKSGRVQKSRPLVDVSALAESIRSLDRERLNEELSHHSASTLRSLCVHLGLRGMSKRPKEELIQTIVRHLIGFGEEHRRISTFSQRQRKETELDTPSAPVRD